ncbi:MAG: COX15/CtaA family protein [Planctomycetota bacterium]
MAHADPIDSARAGLSAGLITQVGITLGFAVAVAMWCVGYITHLPAVQADSAIVGVLMLVTQFVGGVAAARLRPSGGLGAALAIAGVAALTTGAINLLVLGSVVTDDESGALRSSALVVIAGAVVISLATALLGALAGVWLERRSRAPRQTIAIDRDRVRTDWFIAFAAITAVAALPVILSGGLVTSHNAGLAVPDWPTSFNENMFLYPLSRMTGGIYYEHAHRLFGSLVGLCTLALFAMSLVAARGVMPRVLTLAALLLVSSQGAIGGLRVIKAEGESWRETHATVADVDPSDVTNDYALTTDTGMSVFAAVTHGVTGQITLAWLAALPVVLAMRARAERRTDQSGAIDRRAGVTSPVLATVFVAGLVFQLVMGASARHLGDAGLKGANHALITHVAFAVVLAVVGTFAAARAARSGDRLQRQLGGSIAGLLVAQVTLGFVAIALVLPYSSPAPAGEWEATFATAHQATGALLLGAAAMLAVSTARVEARAPKRTAASPGALTEAKTIQPVAAVG